MMAAPLGGMLHSRNAVINRLGRAMRPVLVRVKAETGKILKANVDSRLKRGRANAPKREKVGYHSSALDCEANVDVLHVILKGCGGVFVPSFHKIAAAMMVADGSADKQIFQGREDIAMAAARVFKSQIQYVRRAARKHEGSYSVKLSILKGMCSIRRKRLVSKPAVRVARGFVSGAKRQDVGHQVVQNPGQLILASPRLMVEDSSPSSSDGSSSEDSSSCAKGEFPAACVERPCISDEAQLNAVVAASKAAGRAEAHADAALEVIHSDITTRALVPALHMYTARCGNPRD